MKDLQNKFCQLREHYFLTQKQFAEILGVSRQAVSRWKREENEPSIETLNQICLHFHLPKEYFTSDKFNPALLEQSYYHPNECVEEIAIAAVKDEGETAEAEVSAHKTKTKPKSGRALKVSAAVIGVLLSISGVFTLIEGIKIIYLLTHSMSGVSYNMGILFIGCLILSTALFAIEFTLLRLAKRKMRKSENAAKAMQEEIVSQRESD